MTETTNLHLPLIAAGQAQKHVTHNEALLIIDALTQLTPTSRIIVAPPSTVSEGETYIVGSPPSGLWANKANQIALYRSGVWVYLTPQMGWQAYLKDEEINVVYDGVAWVEPTIVAAPHTHAPPTELHNLTKLGVGTTADAYNPFSVKVNNALFTSKNTGDGGSGDMRLVFNKEAVGNVLSIMLQDNWSGRAEFGLVGSDDLSFRVSPDGSNWLDAFIIDKTTGIATFAMGTERTQLDVFTTNGTWTKPVWAKRILAIAIGAGSGGGSGRRGAASTACFGGGGGGSGGVAKAEWLSAEIGNTLTFVIGAGGIGGASQSLDNADGNPGTAGGDTIISDDLNIILTGYGAVGATGTGDAANQGKAVSGGGCAGGIGSVRSNAGGNASVLANGASGGISAFAEGAGGGGSGGSISASNALTNAGEGGAGYFIGGANRKSIGGQAGGAGNGGWDANDKAWSRGAGGGGGGGGAGDASGSSSGGAGGKGGNPAGGGGGGGASINGANSGAGGNGGRGEVWIISIG